MIKKCRNPSHTKSTIKKSKKGKIPNKSKAARMKKKEPALLNHKNRIEKIKTQRRETSSSSSTTTLILAIHNGHAEEGQ